MSDPEPKVEYSVRDLFEELKRELIALNLKLDTQMATLDQRIARLEQQHTEYSFFKQDLAIIEREVAVLKESSIADNAINTYRKWVWGTTGLALLNLAVLIIIAVLQV